MLVVFCAMKCEASMLIRYYSLKKKQYTAFQIFENDDKTMALVVTGVGKNAAATALGTIAGKYGIGKCDYIINFGIAAGKNCNVGNLYVANKLVESCTDRSFYPDMLYNTKIDEATIVTVDNLITNADMSDDLIYDMEATAIYQSANHFVGPHQISFVKLISDNGNGADKIRQQDVEALILQKQEQIIDYVDMIINAIDLQNNNQVFLTNENELLFKKVCEDMKCSKTMERDLYQQFRYYELSNNTLKQKILEMYENEKLPCIDKKRGKVYLDELKRAVIQ